MSNILKVTTPVGGYENGNNIKMNPVSNPETQGIQAPVNPQKVVRADGRSDAGKDKNTQLKLNYESNFNHFIKRLNNSPDRVEEFTRILLEKKELLMQPDIRDGTAGELAHLFSMIGLKEADMASYVKEQTSLGVRFKGPFFDLLRKVLNETDSVELKAGILDFARRYADMSSGDHLIRNIADALGKCREYMFSKPAGELARMTSALNSGSAHVNGETQKNAKLLKEKILPFLNEYISAVHDRGELRNYTADIAYRLARYENGSMDGLLQSFRRLMGYQGFRKVFGGVDESLAESIMDKSARPAAGWDKEFLSLLRSGLEGKNGTEARQISRNFINSVLLNESVYMPVLHLMLPMVIDDRLLYSEMWINPEDKSSASGTQEHAVKALIKFDIEQVGFFDLFFVYSNGKMDMQLDYPENFRKMDREIRQGIGKILAGNGIRLQNLVTGISTESIPLTEAFPEIYERKNTVNVRV